MQFNEDDLLRHKERKYTKAINSNYEDKHYRIETPSLIDVIKLRMYEIGLKQSDLAVKLGVPSAKRRVHNREAI